MGTSPDIDKRRNPAGALCVVLAVLCVALGCAAWYFWHNGNERAAQAEAKAEEYAGYCDTLIRAGNLAIERADELFDTSDELLHEAQEQAGYRFTYGGFRQEFDGYLESTWNHTAEFVGERLPQS